MRTCKTCALSGPFVLFGLLVITGCGSGVTKVEGIVTLDGKPLPGATVSFLPVKKDGKAASGRTDNDGTFRLTTFRTDDGALSGEYQVIVILDQGDEYAGRDPHMITDEEKRAMRMGTMTPAGKKQTAENRKKQVSPVPAIYSDLKKTPLREVVPASGRIELALKSDAK